MAASSSSSPPSAAAHARVAFLMRAATSGEREMWKNAVNAVVPVGAHNVACICRRDEGATVAQKAPTIRESGTREGDKALRSNAGRQRLLKRARAMKDCYMFLRARSDLTVGVEGNGSDELVALGAVGFVVANLKFDDLDSLDDKPQDDLSALTSCVLDKSIELRVYGAPVVAAVLQRMHDSEHKLLADTAAGGSGLALAKFHIHSLFKPCACCMWTAAAFRSVFNADVTLSYSRDQAGATVRTPPVVLAVVKI